MHQKIFLLKVQRFHLWLLFTPPRPSCPLPTSFKYSFPPWMCLGKLPAPVSQVSLGKICRKQSGWSCCVSWRLNASRESFKNRQRGGCLHHSVSLPFSIRSLSLPALLLLLTQVVVLVQDLVHGICCLLWHLGENVGSWREAQFCCLNLFLSLVICQICHAITPVISLNYCLHMLH